MALVEICTETALGKTSDWGLRCSSMIAVTCAAMPFAIYAQEARPPATDIQNVGGDNSSTAPADIENPRLRRPLAPPSLTPLDLSRMNPLSSDLCVDEAIKTAPEAKEALLAAATPAESSTLPDPVRAMIVAAFDTEKEETVLALLELARKTNPESADEIEAIKLAYKETRSADIAVIEAEKIEALRTAGWLENWEGRGEIGGFQSSGNANVLGITAALNLDKLGFNWRHRFNGRVDYQEADNVVGRQQYLATYEPNRRISERLFAFSLLQYESDQFQGFSGR